MRSLSSGALGRGAAVWLLVGTGLFYALCGDEVCAGPGAVIALGKIGFWPLWELIPLVADPPPVSESAHLYWLLGVLNMLLFSALWILALSWLASLGRNALMRRRPG